MFLNNPFIAIFLVLRCAFCIFWVFSVPSIILADHLGNTCLLARGQNLNDLAFSFDNVLSDPFVLPNGTRLNSLLYANDLIILSRSKLGLQNCLKVLSSYCNSWMLRINPKKTKIMIFQRCTRKCEHNFRIGNEVIDVVQNYTYLGTRITSSAKFYTFA